MKFLRPREFSLEFPLDGTSFVSGSYGKVYTSTTSKGSFAVKVCEDKIIDTINFDVILELNCYASVKHDCLIDVVAWTYNGSRTFFAMPKGIDIRTAYMSKLITAEQIVSDTLSCIAYLHSQSIIHGDVKPSNIVFLNGRAVLIDMGLTRMTIESGGRKYFNRMAYSPCYRNPEYSPHQWNLIECELYALAKTWYHIFTDTECIFNNALSFSYDDDPRINELLQEMKKPVKERLSASQLVDMGRRSGVIVREWTGERMTTPTVSIDPLCGDLQAVLMDWICDVANYFKLDAQTLFLTLHLIHRSLALVVPDYPTNRSRIQVVGLGCLYLASQINETTNITMNDLRRISVNVYSTQDINDTTVTIMKELNCIISSPTYWDYASCAEDLPELLNDTISCHYDPTRIRPLLESGSSKDILASQIMWYKDKTTEERTEILKKQIKTPLELPNVSITRPANIVIAPDIDIITNTWNKIKYVTHWTAVFNGITILNYNRDVIKELPSRERHRIYNIIESYSEFAEFLGILAVHLLL
jgi:serine/threonine protein kinase